MDVQFYSTDGGPQRDSNRWLALHSTTILTDYDKLLRLEFECRCTQLTSEGRCAIWEDRPMVCELFIAGSQACLDTVKKRRLPEQYEQIREEDDPATIHDPVQLLISRMTLIGNDYVMLVDVLNSDRMLVLCAMHEKTENALNEGKLLKLDIDSYPELFLLVCRDMVAYNVLRKDR
jgi:hypothetical protein